MCNPPYDPKVNNSVSKFITTEAATYTSPFGEENSDTRPTTRAKSRTNQRTPFVQSAPQLLPTHVRAHNMSSRILNFLFAIIILRKQTVFFIKQQIVALTDFCKIY